MSIAWATVVLVVLLLPGFVFFWGFYAPNQVTREAVPVSPLGQLAGVVVFAFFVHAAAYRLINGQDDCRRSGAGREPFVPCVDFDQLAALLRIDGAAPAGRQPPSLRAMLDAHAGWILGYFAATAGLSFLIGFAGGKLVESGRIPLSRHRYLSMLEEGRRGDAGPAASQARLVRAHVLSRTSNDGLVLIYDGVLRDFYAKADGTISYIVLRGARCGTIRISAEPPRRSGQTIPLDDEGRSLSGGASLLVLTSEDIANVYFEPLSTVTRSVAEERSLDEALERLEGSHAGDSPS